MPKPPAPFLAPVPPAPTTPYSFDPIRLPTAQELAENPGGFALFDWYETYEAQPPTPRQLAAELTRRQPGAKKQEEKFADWIFTWNNTRTGVAATNATLLALQLAARDEFGAPTPFLRSELRWDRVRKAYDASGPRMREFLRAMYHWTQEELKTRGVEGAVLWRGLKGETPGYYMRVPPNKNFYAKKMENNPLSAFTFDFAQAVRFSGPYAGAINLAYIPASRFLATPLTGIGVVGQSEIVGTGIEKDECFWMAWENSTDAQNYRNLRLSDWLKLVENYTP